MKKVWSKIVTIVTLLLIPVLVTFTLICFSALYGWIDEGVNAVDVAANAGVVCVWSVFFALCCPKGQRVLHWVIYVVTGLVAWFLLPFLLIILMTRLLQVEAVAEYLSTYRSTGIGELVKVAYAVLMHLPLLVWLSWSSFGSKDFLKLKSTQDKPES